MQRPVSGEEKIVSAAGNIGRRGRGQKKREIAEGRER
jgi:hypothetical protein